MRKLITISKYPLRNNYYVDSNGHIWSEYKQGYMFEQDDRDGYKKVTLMTTDRPPSKGHRFSVHRLILENFNPIENMENFHVDHINGDKTDNRLENLRWATPQENVLNKNTFHTHLSQNQDGIKNASSRFKNVEELLLLIEDINSGLFTQRQILQKWNISHETMRKIIARKNYKKELADVLIEPKFISVR